MNQHPHLHELVRGVDVVLAWDILRVHVLREELQRVVGPVDDPILSLSAFVRRGIILGILFKKLVLLLWASHFLHGCIFIRVFVEDISERWLKRRLAARPEVKHSGDAVLKSRLGIRKCTDLTVKLGEDLVLGRVLELGGFGGDRNGGGSDEEGSLHFSV